MSEAKEFWKSKTFWFSILTLAVCVAGVFGFADFEPDAKLLEYAGIIVAIVNIILRFVTKGPVKLK